MMPTDDIWNKWLVASQGDDVVIMRPEVARRLTQREALVLAAWLVAISMHPFEEFQKVYEAVCNT